jgi:hypothetical protein
MAQASSSSKLAGYVERKEVQGIHMASFLENITERSDSRNRSTTDTRVIINLIFKNEDYKNVKWTGLRSKEPTARFHDSGVANFGSMTGNVLERLRSANKSRKC